MNTIRKLFVIAFLVFLPFKVQSVSFVIEDFNTHYWFGPGWGGRDTIMSNTTLDGRKVLSVVNVTAVGNYMPIRSNTFPGEDWSNVELVRGEFLLSGPATTDIKLEMHDRGGASMNPIILYSVSSGTWQDLAFTGVNTPNPVCWLNITAEPLGANECTFYFNDLRLIMDDGTTWYWDDFDSQGKNYSCGGSYVAFNPDNPGVVSHLASTSTVNAGAGYMNWNYNSANTYAEIQITGLNEDWKNYNTLKADVNLLPDVWTSTTAIPIKAYMWFGVRGDGQDTDYRYVSSSGTWQTLYWSLPSYTTFWNVTEFKPGLGWLDLFPGGTFYIDNIMVGNIDVTGIVKSTDVAVAKPGDVVTITLAYGNAGDIEAPNLYITEVVPFNTLISEEPTAGSADSVQYYVGSSWTDTYDAAATKIRWKDLLAPPGSHSVSYKLKIK